MKRKKKKNVNTKNASSNNFETPDEICKRYNLYICLINDLYCGYTFPNISLLLDGIDHTTLNCMFSTYCFKDILIQKYKKVKAENPDKSNFQILKIFISNIVDDEICGETTLLPPPYWYKSGYLSKKDIDDTKNIILAVCMEIWLEYDKKARQTISSFSHHKFLLKGEVKNMQNNSYISPKTIDDNMRNVEKRADAYRKVLLIQLKNMNAKQINNVKKIRGKRYYPFLNLAFMDMLSDNRTTLFDMLYSYKEVLTNSKYKNKNKGLEIAIKDYNSLIEEISHIRENREYLCKCFVLRTIEQTTRIRLSANISKYLVYNHLNPEIIKEDSIKNFLSLFWNAFENGFIRREIYDSFDIHNYSQKIYTSFNYNCSSIDVDGELAIRVITTKLLRHIQFAIKLCCNKKNAIPSWTDTDFAEAADFFRNEYVVTEKIPTPERFKFNNCIELISASDKKNFYDNIRTMYSYISSKKDMPLYYARKRLYKKFR